MGEAKVKPNEVLIVEGRWSIERSWEKPSQVTIRPSYWHDNTKSFIKHRCPGEKRVPTVYGWPNEKSTCWRCDEPIPDGIQALWRFHNWEVLQRER